MTVTECRIPQFIAWMDGSPTIQTLCRFPPVTFTHPSCGCDYPDFDRWRFMTHRMPRPEDVSRDHIDATVMGFLKGERDADWTEVSLVTLHPREEIRLVLKENAGRYRSVHERRFRELLARLRSRESFCK